MSYNLLEFTIPVDRERMTLTNGHASLNVQACVNVPKVPLEPKELFPKCEHLK